MFKKLWKWLLLIIIVIVAIYFPVILETVGGWLSTFFTGSGLGETAIGIIKGLPWWVGPAVAVGSAYVLAPETTAELVQDIGNGVKDVTDKVVDVVGGVAGTVVSKLWPYALAALGVFLLVSGGKKRPEIVVAAGPANDDKEEEENVARR